MEQAPGDFIQEVDRAAAAQDRGHLFLLLDELNGMPWEAQGKVLVESKLAAVPAPASADRLVLFTGHRVDAPGRAKRRFPPEAEPIASAAIRRLLIEEQQQGTVIGLAGGADGGDILFLEACRELGIAHQMLLVFPQPLFIEESVAAQGNWVARFQSLASESESHVLGDSKELPAWLKSKPDYSMWARNNLWMIHSALAVAPRVFVLGALWDGGVGDGPGGTEHMVRVAQAHGAQFTHLDTRQLFATHIEER